MSIIYPDVVAEGGPFYLWVSRSQHLVTYQKYTCLLYIHDDQCVRTLKCKAVHISFMKISKHRKQKGHKGPTSHAMQLCLWLNQLVQHLYPSYCHGLRYWTFRAEHLTQVCDQIRYTGSPVGMKGKASTTPHCADTKWESTASMDLNSYHVYWTLNKILNNSTAGKSDSLASVLVTV